MEVLSMSYDYTINDIAAKTNVSLQSCYGLIKKNREFVDNNSVRRHRKIYYNQEVMNFFIDYYQPGQPAEDIENPIVAEMPPEGQSPSANFPVLSPDKPVENENQPETNTDALKAKIDALQAEISVLKNELATKEEERKELFRQNSALLLIIQQEKAEKQLLLPAPKKSLSVRFKTFLKSRSHHE